ncbi:hypothetical protein IE81DRAFT_349719 [Ceraceosorus guamensis]|uniref:Uncharacterized protein n=1 Tax=Ceraceosorus guamensis TaxID=1522189 RepID=A0A316VQZ5_9BASI|nr:hypothetical protein IE81DRAFT_349719 [Ceraceosorus guamensis]PWN39942.1 hypothetical protein IE81DRAFT_349719 [Ceraceosorus guamensis]
MALLLTASSFYSFSTTVQAITGTALLILKLQLPSAPFVHLPLLSPPPAPLPLLLSLPVLFPLFLVPTTPATGSGAQQQRKRKDRASASNAIKVWQKMDPSSKFLHLHKTMKSCQAIGTLAKELEDGFMDVNAIISEHDVPATCLYLAAELSVEEASRRSPLELPPPDPLPAYRCSPLELPPLLLPPSLLALAPAPPLLPPLLQTRGKVALTAPLLTQHYLHLLLPLSQRRAKGKGKLPPSRMQENLLLVAAAVVVALGKAALNEAAVVAPQEQARLRPPASRRSLQVTEALRLSSPPPKDTPTGPKAQSSNSGNTGDKPDPAQGQTPATNGANAGKKNASAWQLIFECHAHEAKCACKVLTTRQWQRSDLMILAAKETRLLPLSARFILWAHLDIPARTLLLILLKLPTGASRSMSA